MFAPGFGLSEDPITGSLNAAIAHWLDAARRLDHGIVIAQGGAIGREGRIHIRPDPAVPARVLIGGHVHVPIDGMLEL